MGWLSMHPLLQQDAVLHTNYRLSYASCGLSGACAFLLGHLWRSRWILCQFLSYLLPNRWHWWDCVIMICAVFVPPQSFSLGLVHGSQSRPLSEPWQTSVLSTQTLRTTHTADAAVMHKISFSHILKQLCWTSTCWTFEATSAHEVSSSSCTLLSIAVINAKTNMHILL